MNARNPFVVIASAVALSLSVPLVASAEPQSGLVGTVADFHGKYGLIVRDARGTLAEVTLHQGTIIKPEGVRLKRGMIVAIRGQAADRAFAAAEIVAPFALSPFARKALAKSPTGADRFDQRSLIPNQPPRSDRWSEGPDQFSLPPATTRDPVNPH